MGVVCGTGKVTVSEPVKEGVDAVPIDSATDDNGKVIEVETVVSGAKVRGHVLNVVNPEEMYKATEETAKDPGCTDTSANNVGTIKDGSTTCTSEV